MAKGADQPKPSNETLEPDSGVDDGSSYATAQANKSEEASDDDADEAVVCKECADDNLPDQEDGAALLARKTSFYEELDRRIDALSKVQKNSHILSDKLFNEIYHFMLSIQDASNEERLRLLRSIPNKVGYKWIKKYDIHIVDTSHILIFKQADGEALDACQRVAKYSRIFDALREIHELEMGNDHPKAKTLYKRVFMKYGKSVPRWVCEMFPLFCPVCVRSNPRKKVKAGHQPLLTRGMNVRAQIDLIDYQSMPDGPFNYVLDYQDHGIKFCQLRALTQRTHRAVAIELIQIFCIFGPPSILQADNGKEFSHGATKSRHVQLDEEVSHFLDFIVRLSKCFS
jgi:hypothetical protein